MALREQHMLSRNVNVCKVCVLAGIMLLVLVRSGKENNRNKIPITNSHYIIPPTEGHR